VLDTSNYQTLVVSLKGGCGPAVPAGPAMGGPGRGEDLGASGGPGGGGPPRRGPSGGAGIIPGLDRLDATGIGRASPMTMSAMVGSVA